MADAYKFGQLMKEFNLKNAFRFFGENENSATLIACSIAVFKGIFRPLFTMMDKKSDPETKKYAAIREGLTEVAAFPLYAATPWIVGKLVDKLAPKDMGEIAKKRMKITSKFGGICVATVIIPAVCNLIQPPIMDAYKKRQDAKKAKTNLDITSVANAESTTTLNKPTTQISTVTPLAAKANYGMKVGG